MSNFFDIPVTTKSKNVGLLYGFLKIVAVCMVLYVLVEDLVLRHELKEMVNDELLASYTKLEGEQRSVTFSDFKQQKTDSIQSRTIELNPKFKTRNVNDATILIVFGYVLLLGLLLFALYVVFELIIAPFKAHEEIALLKAEIVVLESRIDELEEERYVE